MTIRSALNAINRHRGRAFLVGSAVVVLLAAHFVVPFGQICKTAKDGTQYDCALYDITLVLLWHLREALNDYAPLLTVVATAAIAWFTLALRRSTEKLWKAGEKQSEIAAIAANAAKESAEATRDSVATMKETAERQLRAYLIVVGPSSCTPFNPPGAAPNVKFEIRVVLKNTGQTPAYEVSGLLDVKVWPTSLPPAIDLTLTPPSADRSTTVVGTGQDMVLIWQSPELTPAGAAEVRAGNKKRLYYIGRVTYRDAFGHQRFTQFLGNVIWGAAGIPIFLNADRYNDAD